MVGMTNKLELILLKHFNTFFYSYSPPPSSPRSTGPLLSMPMSQIYHNVIDIITIYLLETVNVLLNISHSH